MNTTLDLYDIQGNIANTDERRISLKARYILYRINDAEAGCKFVSKLVPKITSGAPTATDNMNPVVTMNIAFTYEGLKHLGVPELSLHSFPEEFSMGMKARCDILDDTGDSAPDKWDPVWKSDEHEQPVHMFISVNGPTVSSVEERYQELCKLVKESGNGVEQLVGHRDETRNDAPYQEGAILVQNGIPVPKEHFGYTDGISETYFKGCGGGADGVIGGGKPTEGDPRTAAGWAPLETGEFLLGHKDEAFEYPAAPIPSLLARNGTFMVYRKLHQNVGTFNKFLVEVGAKFPGGKEALAAKFVGRWRNGGAPLVDFPTELEADKFKTEFDAAEAEYRRTGTPAAKARYAELQRQRVGFNYNDDLDGVRCPTGAHIRRINPRGSLEFNKKGAFNTPGALDNRRRIIRRGTPYGEVKDPASDKGNHGIIVLILNASIGRQFEFVQQQWINFGNDFRLANEKDSILGNHGPNDDVARAEWERLNDMPPGSGQGRMVMQADPQGDKPPFLCNKIPTFVETRGGDYFFVPSLTALQLIGDGVVDPT